mmetsp:Transcript_25711/g.40836  ORF Transcript_25711/g.40836 Transcript_25711/m.40836 type:complete len:221 (-) Transcript_25711:226-888(-)
MDVIRRTPGLRPGRLHGTSWDLGRCVSAPASATKRLGPPPPGGCRGPRTGGVKGAGLRVRGPRRSRTSQRHAAPLLPTLPVASSGSVPRAGLRRWCKRGSRGCRSPTARWAEAGARQPPPPAHSATRHCGRRALSDRRRGCFEGAGQRPRHAPEGAGGWTVLSKGAAKAVAGGWKKRFWGVSNVRPLPNSGRADGIAISRGIPRPALEGQGWHGWHSERL